MDESLAIPGYRIEKELGQGGMARVYLAHEEKLERHVALKVMMLSPTQDRTLSQRFIKEAKTAAKLRHSNIVSIFDVGETGQVYYMAMEYLDGGSLKDRILRGAIEPAQALAIVRQIATALGYAHGMGYIHRDIKPDNIMFRKDGTAVITDFGIARAMDSKTKLTKTGMSIGTPHYMSPEQARSRQLDGRSDIYSLGCVLYEMLAGKVPYEADDSVGVIIQHLQEPIPQLPVSLGRYQPLIDQMMAKDPARRVQSADQACQLIDSYLGTRAAPMGAAYTPEMAPPPSVSPSGDELPGRKAAHQEAQRGDDLHLSVTIGSEEAKVGLVKSLDAVRLDHCDRCGSSGTVRGSTCPECRGSGRREIVDNLQVRLPAGVQNGTKLRVPGKGDVGKHGGPDGDLYVIVTIDTSPRPVSSSIPGRTPTFSLLNQLDQSLSLIKSLSNPSEDSAVAEPWIRRLLIHAWISPFVVYLVGSFTLPRSLAGNLVVDYQGFPPLLLRGFLPLALGALLVFVLRRKKSVATPLLQFFIALSAMGALIVSAYLYILIEGEGQSVKELLPPGILSLIYYVIYIYLGTRYLKATHPSTLSKPSQLPKVDFYGFSDTGGTYRASETSEAREQHSSVLPVTAAVFMVLVSLWFFATDAFSWIAFNEGLQPLTLPIWNCVLAMAIVSITIGVFMKREWARQWGLGTSALNGLGNAVDAVRLGTGLLWIGVVVQLAAVIPLALSKKEFKRYDQSKTTLGQLGQGLSAIAIVGSILIHLTGLGAGKGTERGRNDLAAEMQAPYPPGTVNVRADGSTLRIESMGETDGQIIVSADFMRQQLAKAGENAKIWAVGFERIDVTNARHVETIQLGQVGDEQANRALEQQKQALAVFDKELHRQRQEIGPERVVPVPAGSLSLGDLIAKNVWAHGGIERIRAIRSYRIAGYLIVQEAEMPLVTTARRPSLLRHETSMGFLTIVQAFDGTRAWQVNPLEGMKGRTDMPVDQAKDFIESADFDGPLVDHGRKTLAIQLLGQVEIVDRTAFKLRVTMRSGSVKYYYLDTRNYLEVKTTVASPDGTKGAPTETYFLDYRTVGGLVLPFNQLTYYGEQKFRYVVSKVETNIDVSGDFFVKP